jgi:hypothetical protein
VLHRGTADDTVWRTLTDDLRLTVAQLYLTSLEQVNDDVRAARLAAAASRENDFPDMLHRQCQAWRRTFLPLARGNGPVAVRSVGADMEMVTVPVRPERVDHGAARFSPYRFLVRHCGFDTAIAGLEHRLPVPGWPPTLWSIPHLR